MQFYWTTGKRPDNPTWIDLICRRDDGTETAIEHPTLNRRISEITTDDIRQAILDRIPGAEGFDAEQLRGDLEAKNYGPSPSRSSRKYIAFHVCIEEDPGPDEIHEAQFLAACEGAADRLFRKVIDQDHGMEFYSVYNLQKLIEHLQRLAAMSDEEYAAKFNEQAAELKRSM